MTDSVLDVGEIRAAQHHDPDGNKSIFLFLRLF